MKHRTVAALLTAALILLCLVPASARGRIAEIGIKDRAPEAGSRIELQVALVASDAAGLAANGYSVLAELRDANGAQLAQIAEVAGVADVTPARAGVVLVPLDLPKGITGTVVVSVVLIVQGEAVDRSDPQTLVVGGLALAPVAPVVARAGGRFSLAGTLTASGDSARGVFGQSSLLALDGHAGDASFATSGGLSTSIGANKPVFSFRTRQSETQIGTFAPSFDPLVFDGPLGLALAYRAAPDDRHALQATYVLAARGSLNPFQAGAVNYHTTVGRASGFGATVTTFKVDGEDDPLSAEPLPNNGSIVGFSFGREAPNSIFGYTLRYALGAYRDKRGNALAGNAFGAVSNVTVGKAALSFDYRRTSPNYPNLLASGIVRDRESSGFSLATPILGAITSTFSVRTDRDDLPGASLAQRSRSFTEAFGLNVPLRNGDSLSYALTGSTSHLAANLDVAATALNAASAGDGQNIGYNFRRGAYTFGYTLGYTNQRDNLGNLQHTTQNGFSLARAVVKGLTFSSNVTLNTAVASTETSSNSGVSANLALGYVLGPLELTTSYATARTRPFLGLEPPDSGTLSIGARFIEARGFTVQGGMTQSTTGIKMQSGTINVTQKF